MFLIVGLGNPGEKYQNTRHNLGFMVVDALARKFSIFHSEGIPRSGHFQFSIDKDVNAEILKTKFADKKIVLVKPLTFMNASGKAVAKLASSFRLQASSIWVVHDDIDLPLGKIKIRLGGGSAGHRGIESIIKELGTDKFVRFRLGIGHPRRNLKFKTENLKSVEGYVLEKFQTKEKSEVKKMIKKAIKAIQVALKKGPERAMNEFNA